MHDRLDHVRGWLRKADSDLKTAKLVVAADGPYDTACYHTQQAVEKHLKHIILPRKMCAMHGAETS